MSKKNIVLIVLAVACFGGAIWVLYNNGVFGGEKVAGNPFARPGASKNIVGPGSEPVLPHGKLVESDFDKAFAGRNTGMYKIAYPKLNFDSDVKIDVKELFGTVSTSTFAQ